MGHWGLGRERLRLRGDLDLFEECFRLVGFPERPWIERVTDIIQTVDGQVHVFRSIAGSSIKPIG